MNVGIMCLVAFALLMWVLILKSHITRLEKENAILKEKMRTKLAKVDEQIEVLSTHRIPTKLD